MSSTSPVRTTSAAVHHLDQVWFTVAETAVRTRRHRNSIYRAIHAGELITEQRNRPGARHLIHRDQIDAWIRGERPQRLRPTG